MQRAAKPTPLPRAWAIFFLRELRFPAPCRTSIPMQPPANHRFDVVVIGGAFSGAATGLLLKRRRPQLRVAIVERAAAFDRKVGESTTEVSSCFLTRVLGLT